MYGKDFDMIYNSKMFANKEFLYQHIFENMVLNNRGEEFGTTFILAKNEGLMWDIIEALRKISNIEVKNNCFRVGYANIEYQYMIPRTNKISVNKIEIIQYNENINASFEKLRGYRYRTLILDMGIDDVKSINRDIWDNRLLFNHRPIKDNYTDAKIFIY